MQTVKTNNTDRFRFRRNLFLAYIDVILMHIAYPKCNLQYFKIAKRAGLHIYRRKVIYTSDIVIYSMNYTWSNMSFYTHKLPLSIEILGTYMIQSCTVLGTLIWYTCLMCDFNVLYPIFRVKLTSLHCSSPVSTQYTVIQNLAVYTERVTSPMRWIQILPNIRCRWIPADSYSITQNLTLHV